ELDLPVVDDVDGCADFPVVAEKLALWAGPDRAGHDLVGGVGRAGVPGGDGAVAARVDDRAGGEGEVGADQELTAGKELRVHPVDRDRAGRARFAPDDRARVRWALIDDLAAAEDAQVAVAPIADEDVRPVALQADLRTDPGDQSVAGPVRACGEG